MSMLLDDPTELTTQQWSERERIIKRFEAEWRRGARPDLSDYLPDGAHLRRAVLRELVHTDLEYRLKDGEPARVEEYLARFPELKSDPEVELELITAELGLRRRRESDLAVEEFWARFPEYQAELVPTWRRPPSSGADPREGSHPSWAAADPHGPDSLRRSRPAPGRLGKYELLEEVGRGAFGIVYRARDAELDRVVALKVPRSGHLATPGEVDRFLREARSAAQLDHPSIVAIHDAGHADGSCYLACAFVPGTTLARRLADGRLPAREAAELAAAMAEALHHAHLRGVVHRDVKPSNILLGRDGVPRLTDFGLAKREEGDISLTVDGEPLGTPAYMPPEQARGEARGVDGRGDVYSLGAVLYQMLTGEPVFRGNAAMIRKQVLEDEPTPPRRLDDRIPRDLEVICLKCLQKEPARRYASAAELADDLRRFLRGEPIVARPVGPVGHLGAWCRRKPVVAGLLAGLGLAVSVGLSGVTWQWLRAAREWRRAEANLHLARLEGDRAEENSRLAHRAVDDYLDRVSTNKLLDVPGMQPLRKELMKSALGYYQRFVEQRAGDPAVLAELADAHFKIGFIDSEIGLKGQTLAAYQRARTIYEDLVRSHPREARFRVKLSKAIYNMGTQHRATGQIAEALRSFRDAFAIQEGLARDYPEDLEFRRHRAAGYHNLGLLQFETGHPAEGLESLRRAIAATEELVAADPAIDDRAQLAQFYGTLGAVQFMTGHPSAALDPWRRSAELLRGVTRDRPEVALFRRDLAGTVMNLGALELENRHADEAIGYLREALALQERLVRDNPAVLDYSQDLARTYATLGEAYCQMDRPAEAVRPLEQARDLREMLVRSDPANLDYQSELGRALSPLGAVLATLGDRTKARQVFREAREHHRIAFSRAPDVVPYRRYFGEHYRLLAAAERRLGDPAGAAAAALERRDLWPEDPAELVGVARDLALCISIVDLASGGTIEGRSDGRRTYADLAVDTLRQAIASGFRDLALLHTDHDLEPIRPREDFRRLMVDLMDRVFPAQPFADPGDIVGPASVRPG
jgi:serine/threonine-protein kinase